MPKDSNFFEEAYGLCQDVDPLISITARALYYQMLFQRTSQNILPIGNFNMLYFFQSVIAALSMQFPEITLTSTAFPCHSEPINGYNWLDESSICQLSRTENCEIALRHMELIKEDSVPFGENFDVTYAQKTLMAALATENGNGLLNAWTGHPLIIREQDHEIDFDYWLSGFNSE